MRCGRGNAGRVLSLSVACRWRTKSCRAGTDSRAYALWMPRDRGKVGSPIRVLDVPALQFLKEIVDLARLAPQERVRVAEQTVAVPGPLILEGVAGAVRLREHERISYRSGEHIAEDPVP